MNVTSPVVAWLREVWPAYSWQNAHLHQSCFHDVAVLAPEVVGRASRHGERTERVAREHRILDALVDVRLPYDVPRPLSGVVSRNGRTGMLISFVGGEPRPDIAWEAAAGQIRLAMAAMAQVAPGPLSDRLPEPRSWCGGRRWPELVRQRLLPRLPHELRSVAGDVVANVLDAAQIAGSAQLVHGDFGPHNFLWSGDQIAGLLDFDHACLGDAAIDAATLISFFGAEQVAQIVNREVVERAMIHRAGLSLQLATAADLLGDTALRDHALGNFATRSRTGTLYDPGGWTPDRHGA
ncbi:protein kinase family protein [Flindersiella endophytica]